jgi:hypothetical protein
MNFVSQILQLHPKGVMSRLEIARSPVIFWMTVVGMVDATLGKSFIWLLILPSDIASVLVLIWVLLVGSVDTGVGAGFIGVLVLPMSVAFAPAVVDLVELADKSNEGILGD